MKQFRNAQFVAAIVFLLAAVSFTFGNEGAKWMWRDTPVVGASLAVVSVFFWVLFAWQATKSHPRDNQLRRTTTRADRKNAPDKGIT